MRPNRSTCILLIALTVLTLIGVGCGGPEFSRVNYETIYRGQPASAVEAKLGEPTERRGETWIYIHDEPWYKAAIRFTEGKVADKQWWWIRP